LVTAALAVLLAAVCAARDEEPVARVNGYPITARELDQQAGLAEGGGPPAWDPLPMGPREREAAETQRRREVLEAIIERRVLYDLARDEYEIGEAAEKALERAAEDELSKLEDRLGSRLRAMEMLSQAGLTVEDFKDLQKQNLLAARLLWDKVYSQVSVSPADAREFYEEHTDRFVLPRAVLYRQILFVCADAEETAARREEAEDVLEQIRAGRDFGEAADACSDDRDAYAGGLHEVAVPEELPDWLPPAVEGLEPGETSEVRQVAGGLAIVRLEEVRPPAVAPFEQVQQSIKARLLDRRRAAALADYVERAKARARIEYYPAAHRMGLP
jgi:parvulin-like peptidyl-prolyl isomerase